MEGDSEKNMTYTSSLTDDICVTLQIKRIRNVSSLFLNNFSRQYFCEKTTLSSSEGQLSEKMLQDLRTCMKMTSCKSSSLILRVNNNTCEQLHSLVNKQIAGKRIFYPGSWSLRTDIAVLRRNEDEPHTAVEKSLLGKSPGMSLLDCT